MAPELNRNAKIPLIYRENISTRVDVFSAGVILYTLLTGAQIPWGEASKDDAFYMHMRNYGMQDLLEELSTIDVSHPSFVDKGCFPSSDAMDLLQKMLADEPRYFQLMFSRCIL